MQGSLRLAVLAVLTTFLLAGCSSTNSLSNSDEKAPPNSEAVAEADSLSGQKTPINEQVRRLFVLEARILAAPDSSAADSLHTGRLLNQAMGELAALLDREPSVIERDAVRDVYRGLTKEYRRYHRYEGATDSMETAKGDIFSVRAGLFASLERVDEPLLEDVMAPEAIENIETEIPLTMNRLVKQSLDYLKSDPSKHVDSWLQREQTYGPMIDHILAQEGVPHELRYLAMIESGLNPRARSWAGAVGMWQFMRGTGRMYDLKVDGWIDERRDPEKATRAAARHLRDLYDSLGDWHLVLAAYNCGEGCVRRAVRRTERYDGIKDPNYWEVYDRLPRETRGYVPMFIAATILASQPEKHGIEPPKAAPAYAYDYVAVHGSMLTVYEIARLAETDADVIRALNPELRQRTLPPSREKYYIRIPVGSYPTFAWGYADLPDSKKRPATSYRVRSGDTLSEIADRFGTSTNRLRRTNGIRGSMINIGQTLVVPVRNYDSAIQNASPQQPMRVQYGAVTPVRPLDRIVITDRGLQRSPTEKQNPPVRTASTRSAEQTESSSSATTRKATSTRANQTPSKATASPDASATTSKASSSSPETSSSTSTNASSSSSSASTVTVRRGDTLSDIAARHGVSTRNLQRWNRLGSSRIHPGQTLRLTAPPAGTSTYTVRRGDSLDRIARNHGVTIRELRAWNDLRGSRIYPGQTLEIRDAGGDRPIVYTVQRGDTLSTIAKSYGTSVGQLRMINELRGSRIYPGQKLKIETN